MNFEFPEYGNSIGAPNEADENRFATFARFDVGADLHSREKQLELPPLEDPDSSCWRNKSNLHSNSKPGLELKDPTRAVREGK